MTSKINLQTERTLRETCTTNISAMCAVSPKCNVPQDSIRALSVISNKQLASLQSCHTEILITLHKKYSAPAETITLNENEKIYNGKLYIIKSEPI